MVEWSGTASLRLKSMKRLNIKSLAIRFSKQLLNTENLLEPLLEQINHHLEQNSIIVSLGSIIYSLVFVCLSVVYFCKLCVELCYFVYQAICQTPLSREHCQG
jgi:hypothetical protein